MKKKSNILIFILPILFIFLSIGLKHGYVMPMIKGIDIRIIGGTFITNLNKYVIKVGDEVNVSAGDYIVVPSFAKKPNLKFVILDKKNVLTMKNNKIKALREGYSTIGIMNKNRVLRKATIMVVNPKINDLKINLGSDLNYYGDRSKIQSVVDIEEYKKLEKGYKFNYSTTDPKILKIENDYVEAVGTGEAKLISRYDRKEIQKTIKIYPRVDELSIDKYFEIEQNQSVNLNPSIKTSPNNEKSEVKYSVLDNVDQSKYDENKRIINGDSGIETSYGITIDANGRVNANRIGTYQVEINSGNKKAYTSVSVVKPEFGNIEIKNLQYRLSNDKDSSTLEIGWDFSEYVNTYRVYLKKGDGEFEAFTNIKAYKRSVPVGNRVSTILKLEKNQDYQIYVVGYNGVKETKPSNIVTIGKDLNVEFQNRKVKGLDYNIDFEKKTIHLKWKHLDNKQKYKYRVYYVNKKLREEKYILYAKNIEKNNVTLKLKDGSINYEFFVVAINSKGQVSDFSKALPVYTSLSD
ncbi:MAG: fibronectin type III domain-containing protein [Peptostreptococcus porci]|nr:fibronectin type III domain-containing protein [Peptostreptococcus porci]